MSLVEKEISKKRVMITIWDDEYIPSEEEQDDEISNYCSMAKDQSDEVINSNFENCMLLRVQMVY